MAGAPEGVAVSRERQVAQSLGQAGGRRWLIPALVVVSLLAVACGSSGEEGADTASEGEIRQAAAPAIAAKVVSGASAAFSALNECLENQEVGQPCLASDSDNIRATLAEVRALRADIAANQQQALNELDAIRNLIRNQNVRDAAENLRPMVVNTELAGRAYDALAECAESTTGTCVPFIGRDGDPAEDVATAIAKTRDYFLEKAGNLPDDLPVTASWFTGSGPSYNDGLADAIWMFNKGAQDQAAGVTDAAVKNRTVVPVVTPDLATAQNQDIGYWADIFSEYAFLAVLYAGLSGGERVAERRQADADTRIGDETNRRSVLGSTAHYALPEISGTGVVLADGDRAWLVADGTVRGGRPLEPGDLETLSQIVGTYAPLTSFAKVPRAMPPDRWYSVRTPVERIRYPRLELWAMGGFGVTSKLQTWNNVDANWLVDAASATDFCPSRARPVSTPPVRKSTAVAVDDELWVKPEFSPEQRLTTTWEQQAAGRPIEFTWAGLRKGDLDLGWGAWVACTPGAPTGTVVELLRVPGVMGPVR